MKHLAKRLFFTLAILCFSALFVYSACKLYGEYADHKKNARAYEAVAALVQTEPPAGDTSAPAEAGSGAGQETAKSFGVTEQDTAGITAYETYRAVYEQNHDFVGWLSISDTSINYPVVQTPEDPDHYLRRGFDGEYSYYGVPYVQSNCDLSSSSNLVIYGHNMNDGSMFADLCEYADQDFYREHPTIRFDTLAQFGEYQVIAAFKTVAYSDAGFAYYQFVDGSQEDFEAYVAQCKALSLYDTGVTAEYGDRLITLSTCEYSRDNGRMVVVAKRVGAD